MSYQNQEQKVYKNANVGKLYKKTGQYGDFFSGDFCSLQIFGKIDQEGNISLQFPTEFAAELKEMVSAFKDQSGLAEKYEADRQAYLAKKEAQESQQPKQAPKPAYAPKTYAKTYKRI